LIGKQEKEGENREGEEERGGEEEGGEEEEETRKGNSMKRCIKDEEERGRRGRK
jgi:hypothetical protein